MFNRWPFFIHSLENYAKQINALKKKKDSEHLKHLSCGKNTLYSRWRSTTSKIWCHSSAVKMVLCLKRERRFIQSVCKVISLNIYAYNKEFPLFIVRDCTTAYCDNHLKKAPTHRVSVSSHWRIRWSCHWFGCSCWDGGELNCLWARCVGRAVDGHCFHPRSLCAAVFLVKNHCHV